MCHGDILLLRSVCSVALPSPLVALLAPYAHPVALVAPPVCPRARRRPSASGAAVFGAIFALH
eukprot:6335940-Lingulodinium_polyedra.AAC.1